MPEDDEQVDATVMLPKDTMARHGDEKNNDRSSHMKKGVGHTNPFFAKDDENRSHTGEDEQSKTETVSENRKRAKQRLRLRAVR